MDQMHHKIRELLDTGHAAAIECVIDRYPVRKSTVIRGV